jgi:hypothetical protein
MKSKKNKITSCKKFKEFYINQYVCLTDDWKAVSYSFTPIFTMIIKKIGIQMNITENGTQTLTRKINVLRFMIGWDFNFLYRILHLSQCNTSTNPPNLKRYIVYDGITQIY